jgi:K+-transporting ATPase A subunit
MQALLFFGLIIGLFISTYGLVWLCARMLSGANHRRAWQQYALAMLLFNALGIGVIYLLQRMQALLPLNRTIIAGARPLPGTRS